MLDTWFSSGLWPFSTLGWPDDTADLRTFYPTSLLISGYDILFFWDARMIMMGLHLTGGAEPSHERIPFRRLYLHSLVRTAEGAKMSKTKGTGVDPLQLTQKYGTDALRYMLASMAAPGTDIILSEDRILGARAFANKIWNAARFLFVNLEKVEASGLTLEELAAPEIRAEAPYPRAGRRRARASLDFLAPRSRRRAGQRRAREFPFSRSLPDRSTTSSGAISAIGTSSGSSRNSRPTDREVALAAWRNIFAALDAALRLLHPVMPFLTEELWHKLPQTRRRALDRARHDSPSRTADWADARADDDMALLQEIIIAARNIRAEMKLDPKRKSRRRILDATIRMLRHLVEDNLDPLLRLATLSELQCPPGISIPAGAAIRSTAAFDLRIAYGDAIDKPAEIARLKKEIERLEKDIESKQKRLADDSFTQQSSRQTSSTPCAPPWSSASSNFKSSTTASSSSINRTPAHNAHFRDKRARLSPATSKLLPNLSRSLAHSSPVHAILREAPRRLFAAATGRVCFASPMATKRIATLPGTTDRRIDALLTLLAENSTIVISGAKIAKEIGVTRQQVWRWIEKLRALGVRVKGHPHTGYHIERMPDILVPQMLEPSSLRHAVRTPHLPFLQNRFDQHGRHATSAKQGEPHGTVVLAEEQTAGRGRAGRSWTSEKSAGIYLQRFCCGRRSPPAHAPAAHAGRGPRRARCRRRGSRHASRYSLAKRPAASRRQRNSAASSPKCTPSPTASTTPWSESA